MVDMTTIMELNYEASIADVTRSYKRKRKIFQSFKNTVNNLRSLRLYSREHSLFVFKQTFYMQSSRARRNSKVPIQFYDFKKQKQISLIS